MSPVRSVPRTLEFGGGRGLASLLGMPEGNHPLSPGKTEDLGRWKGIGSALPLLKFSTACVL